MSELIGRGIFYDNSKNLGVVTTAEFDDLSINSGTVLDTVVFQNSAANTGTLSGEVIAFYDSSENIGNNIKHTPVFADYSINDGIINTGNFINYSTNSGTVTVSSSFADYASNTGTLQGSAFFVEDTTNSGSIELAQITGNFTNTGTIASSAVYIPANGYYVHGYYFNGQRQAPPNYVVQVYKIDNFWYKYDSVGNSLLASGIYNDGIALFNFERGIKKNEVVPTYQYIRLGYATNDSNVIIDSTVLYDSQTSSATVAANVSGIYDFDSDGNNEQWLTDNAGTVTWYTISSQPYEHFGNYSADEMLVKNSSVLKNGFGTGATTVPNLSGIYDFDSDGNNEQWLTNNNGIITWYTISAYPHQHLGYYSADEVLIKNSSVLRNGFGTGATTVADVSGIYDFDSDGNNEQWLTNNNGTVTWYTISSQPHKHFGYYSADESLINGSSVLKNGFGTGAVVVPNVSGVHDFDADGNNEQWLTNEIGIISWYTISAYPYQHLGYYSADQTLNNYSSVLRDGFGTGATAVADVSGIYDFDSDGNSEQWLTNVIGVISWYTISAYPYKHFNYYSTDQVLVSAVSVLRNGFGTGATIVANMSGIYDFNSDGNPERWETDGYGVITWTTPMIYPYNHLGENYYSADINLVNGVSVLWNSPYPTATVVANTTGYHDFDIDGNNEKWTTDQNGIVSWFTLSSQPYQYFGYYSADETLVNGSTVLKDGFGTAATAVSGVSGIYDFDVDGNDEQWYTDGLGVLHWYTISAYPYEHFGYYSADEVLVSNSSVLKTGTGTGASNASNILNALPYLDNTVVSWWSTNENGVISIQPLSSVVLEQGTYYHFGQDVYTFESGDVLYDSNAILVTNELSGIIKFNGVPYFYEKAALNVYVNTALYSVNLQGTDYYHWGGNQLILESGDKLYDVDAVLVTSNLGGLDIINSIPSQWSTDVNGVINITPLSSASVQGQVIYYTGGADKQLGLGDRVYNYNLQPIVSKPLAVDEIEGTFVFWTTDANGDVDRFDAASTVSYIGTPLYYTGALTTETNLYRANGTFYITFPHSTTVDGIFYYHRGSTPGILEDGDVILNSQLELADEINKVIIFNGEVTNFYIYYFVPSVATRAGIYSLASVTLNGTPYYHIGGTDNTILETGDALYAADASKIINNSGGIDLIEGSVSSWSTDGNGIITITPLASVTLNGTPYYHIGGTNNAVLQDGDTLYAGDASRLDNNAGGISLINGVVSYWSTNGSGAISIAALASVTLNNTVYYHTGGTDNAVFENGDVLYAEDGSRLDNNEGGVDLINGTVSSWSTDGNGTVAIGSLNYTIINGTTYYHVQGALETGVVLYDEFAALVIDSAEQVAIINGTVSSWSTNGNGVILITALNSIILNSITYYHFGGTNPNVIETGDYLYDTAAELVANNVGGVDTINGNLSRWFTNESGLLSLFQLNPINLNGTNYYHWGGTDGVLEGGDTLVDGTTYETMLGGTVVAIIQLGGFTKRLFINDNSTNGGIDVIFLEVVIPITLNGTAYYYTGGVLGNEELTIGDFLYNTDGTVSSNNPGGVETINGVLKIWSTTETGSIQINNLIPVYLNNTLYYHYGGSSDALESGDHLLNNDYSIVISGTEGVEIIEGVLSIWVVGANGVVTISPANLDEITLNDTVYYHLAQTPGVLQTGDILYDQNGSGTHNPSINNPGGIELIEGSVSSWYTGPDGVITINSLASVTLNGTPYYHIGGTDNAVLQDGDALYDDIASKIINNAGGIESINGVVSSWSTNGNGIITITPLASVTLNGTPYYHIGGTNNAVLQDGDTLYAADASRLDNNAGGISLIDNIPAGWHTNEFGIVTISPLTPVDISGVTYYYESNPLGQFYPESGDVIYNSSASYYASKPEGLVVFDGQYTKILSTSLFGVATVVSISFYTINGIDYYSTASGGLQTGAILYNEIGIRVVNHPEEAVIVPEESISYIWSTNELGVITIVPLVEHVLDSGSYYSVDNTLQNGASLLYTYEGGVISIAANASGTFDVDGDGTTDIWTTNSNGIVSWISILYWYTATSDNDADKWHTQTSWYVDSSHTIQSIFLPTSATDVIVDGTIGPIADLDRPDWIQPHFIYSGTTGVTFTSQTYQNVTVGISGNATFLGNATYNI